MTRLLACLLILATSVGAAMAQDSDGKGALVRLLQSQLSDAGRDVRIEGFSGGLSRRARLDLLTIADSDGIWLELEDAELDWSRAALFRGELRIETLSAGALRILRRPLPGPATPVAPEARPFALPDLPVAISIARFGIGELVLGPRLLGEPLTARVQASAVLEEGAGSLRLTASRTDGRDAVIDLAAAFEPDDRELALDGSLREARNGLIARLLNLPGLPSVALTLTGQGPLAAFRADIALQTDGKDRMVGQVLTETRDRSQRLTLDVSGDLSPLFLPQYQDFLGDRIALFARAERDDTGVTELEAFSLSARSLSLQGAATLSAAGWPLRLSAAGRLRNPEGGAVLLPPSLGGIRIGDGTLSLAYDQARGAVWRGDAALRGVRGDFGQADALTLAGTGVIRPADRTVRAEIGLSGRGLDLADPAIGEIVGPAPAFEFVLDRTGDGPIHLSDIDARLRAGLLVGQATVPANPVAEPLRIKADARMPDLSVLSKIVGRSLGGAARAGLSGSVNPFSGAGDLVFDATTDGLSLGIPALAPLLQGRTELAARLRRDETGIRLDGLSLGNRAFSAEADFAVRTGAISGHAAFRLATLASLVPELPGPVSARFDIEPADNGHRIGGTATGPAGARVAVSGSGSRDLRTYDLEMTVSAPLSLANPFLRPGSAQGLAEGRFRLVGTPALPNMSGIIAVSRGALAWPGAPVALRSIVGTVALDRGRARVDLGAASSLGGRVELSGSAEIATGSDVALDLALNGLAISQPDLFATRLDGQLAYRGQFGGAARLGGEIDLGPTRIRVPSGGPPDSATIPGLVHLGEPAAVRQTRAHAGLLARDTAPNRSGPARIALDLGLNAPNRITVRGRGVDAELGGAMRVGGTLATPLPQGRFDLIRGRIDILGKRLTLDEGFVQAQGSLIPDISLRASSRSNDVTLRIGLAGPLTGPDITISAVPDLPGDEALARFLFGRGLGSLSALQAAQLASAVVSLRGGGDGILGRLRDSTGLDDLDLSGSSDGGATLRAGKYLSDNVYGDVVVDNRGKSAVTLNLDLSPEITLRGTAESDGGTGFGVFFERDY